MKNVLEQQLFGSTKLVIDLKCKTDFLKVINSCAKYSSKRNSDSSITSYEGMP